MSDFEKLSCGCHTSPDCVCRGAEALNFVEEPSEYAARNEVKNASFAQRSAHRDSRIWRPDRTGRRAQATRAQTTTDVQICQHRPIDFATVQYFIQLPPIMFGFSESADIGLS